MARLLHPPPFTGIRDGLHIYPRKDFPGQIFIRTQSTLSGKRVKTAPEYKKTREYASCMALGSRIASEVYRKSGRKDCRLYRSWAGQAMKMLKEGMGEEEVQVKLLASLQ
jgi:hypothetical protein